MFETNQLWVKVKSDNLVAQILAQYSGKINEKQIHKPVFEKQ